MFQACEIIGKWLLTVERCLGLLVLSADQVLEKYKRSVSKRHFAYRNERDSCENHNNNFSHL